MNSMQAALLLTSNFSDDPLFRHCFRGTDAQRNRGMEAYFNAALDLCMAEGELVLAPGNTGLLGWIPGTAFPPQLDSFKMTGQPAYVQEAWNRFLEHEHTPEHQIQVLAGSTPFAYLWLLAVDFSVRGKGYATWLLDTATEQMREAGLKTIWLSTENETNRAFYIKLGFELAETAKAASGLSTWIFSKTIS